MHGSCASRLLAPLILLVFRSEVAFSIWHVYTFWHKVSSSTNDPKSERRLGFRLNVSRMPCRHKTMNLLFVLANIILFRRIINPLFVILTYDPQQNRMPLVTLFLTQHSFLSFSDNAIRFYFCGNIISHHLIVWNSRNAYENIQLNFSKLSLLLWRWKCKIRRYHVIVE